MSAASSLPQPASTGASAPRIWRTRAATTALRASVESMLAAHDEAGAFGEASFSPCQSM